MPRSSSSFEDAIRKIVADEIQRTVGYRLDLLDRLSGVFANGALTATHLQKPNSSPAPVGTRTRAPNGASGRPCALIGCKKPARSKGYCANHYQKYRSLMSTGRLPSDWKEYAPANTVPDVVLPRRKRGPEGLGPRSL
jgi:hypothetical protein